MRPTTLVTRILFTCVLIAASARTAAADITAFIGGTTTPSNRPVRGVGVGAGLLFLGFEFEYAQTSEDAADAAPGLKTFMGNVLLQTPVPIAGITPYFTTGAGVYRERLGDATETAFGANTGGGAKIRLAGPLRVRFDYRVFTLRGSPREDVVHRFYVGANIAF